MGDFLDLVRRDRAGRKLAEETLEAFDRVAARMVGTGGFSIGTRALPVVGQIIGGAETIQVARKGFEAVREQSDASADEAKLYNAYVDAIIDKGSRSDVFLAQTILGRRLRGEISQTEALTQLRPIAIEALKSQTAKKSNTPRSSRVETRLELTSVKVSPNSALYDGPCPFPGNLARDGSSCGRRSAIIKDGGWP